MPHEREAKIINIPPNQDPASSAFDFPKNKIITPVTEITVPIRPCREIFSLSKTMAKSRIEWG